MNCEHLFCIIKVDWRRLISVRWKLRIFSAPSITETCSGRQRVKAFTGDADHARQECNGSTP
jgi:hypothetical protein